MMEVKEAYIFILSCSNLRKYHKRARMALSYSINHLEGHMLVDWLATVKSVIDNNLE